MKLKVMSFNLRQNTTQDGENAWPLRLDRVIEVIQQNNPHIFGVQEGLHEMVSTLKLQFPSYTMIGNGRGGGEQDEYSAIFFKKNKISLINEGQFWLSETPETPNSKSWDSAYPRICTWGEFKFKRGSSYPFAFFNTHLDHSSQKARENGARLICSKISPYLDKKQRVILTGDLNAHPDNKVIEIILKSDLIKLKTEGKTFHGFNGGISGKPIDYIFVSENIEVQNVKVDRYQVHNRYPSDHYPIVANLVI